MNKGISILWLIIAGVVLIAGSAYWYYVDDVKPTLRNLDKLEYYYCQDGSYYTRVPYDDFSNTHYDKDGNFLTTCERGRNYTEGKCKELIDICRAQKQGQCPEGQSYVRRVIGGWREVDPSDPEGRCVSNQIIERSL